MIALIQRVASARVEVDGEGGPEVVGAIGSGVLAFIGVERGDGEGEAARLVERVLGYRVFAAALADGGKGRMDRSLTEVGGGLLLVPQFTLVADTAKGTRASFTPAAAPDQGRRWFDRMVELAQALHSPVATGRFGAHMQVHLVNDGPVTFTLRVPPGA